VPVPIAARYRRVGRWRYTADLITERIPAASSLAALLRAAPLALSGWIALGRCLRRFHEDGICHADLNAHNVLLDDAGDVWLVDFDRGRLRHPGYWCDGNLVRLRRSIEKVTEGLPPERFSEADWASLLDGYFTALPQASAA
jgi:3-deoxy-D-manno-octulosonic acid kinase